MIRGRFEWALVVGFVAMCFGVSFLANNWRALAASQVTNFQYQYVTTGWLDQNPDAMPIFTANENMHVKAINFVVATPGSGQLVFNAVPDGLPCRNSSGGGNGVTILASGVSGNVGGTPGKRQTLALAPVANLALAVGSSICIYDQNNGDYTHSRGSVTIALGP